MSDTGNKIHPIGTREWLPYVARGLLIIMIVVSLAVAAFYFERQRYIERALVATSNIVQVQALSVEDLFDKIDVGLQSGALFYQHQHISGPFNRDELNEYLKNLESVVSEVDGIRILDARGLVSYGHNIPTGQRTDLSDRAYFKKARDSTNGDLIIDGPLFARIAQKWVVVFARRLSKADGSFDGVIYANLATTKLEKNLSSTGFGPHGAATIRTAELALVHRVPDTRNAVSSKNVSSELSAAVSARPEGGEYIAATALDGVERSNAYRKIGKYPFYVIAGLATQDYLGSSQQNLLIIVSLTLLTIIISVWDSYQGYRSHLRIASDLRERNLLNEHLQRSMEEQERLNHDLALKATEAEVASKAKSAFLANMSHELRTPLHQIHGLAHLVGREPLSARQSERLNTLNGAVQHMTSMVDAVLDLTKIESGSLDLSEESIDLPEVINRVVERYKLELSRKQLVLRVSDIPQIGGLIGDKKHLEQALVNYLANAVRFTQVGSIEIRSAVVREDGLGVLIRFEIEDTGLGIKPEDQPRLFSIFEQVDNSSTRRFGGMGIGLAVTRKISEALGGEAGCQSTYGQGSTFWFTAKFKKKPPTQST